jgi:hypothetical protein
LDRDTILSRVFEQLEQDIKSCDYTAIEELLSRVPDSRLIAFLSEDKQDA